jgi:hypothetical protein
MSFRKNPHRSGIAMKIFFCVGSAVDGVIACWTYIDTIMRISRTYVWSTAERSLIHSAKGACRSSIDRDSTL